MSFRVKLYRAIKALFYTDRILHGKASIFEDRCEEDEDIEAKLNEYKPQAIYNKVQDKEHLVETASEVINNSKLYRNDKPLWAQSYENTSAGHCITCKHCNIDKVTEEGKIDWHCDFDYDVCNTVSRTQYARMPVMNAETMSQAELERECYQIKTTVWKKVNKK